MNRVLLRKLPAVVLSLGTAFAISNANAISLSVDGDLSDLIGAQSQPISGSTVDGMTTGDGFDINTAYFHYDTPSDTFYFGMSVYGTVGDSGFLDVNTAFDSLELYRFLLDLNNDGLDMQYSLLGDGVANSGANSETVNANTAPGGTTLEHAVSESLFASDNGIEFSIQGLGFAGPFTVTLEGSAASGSNQVSVSGVVPVPAAVWLFGSGLLALAGFGRRKVQ